MSERRATALRMRREGKGYPEVTTALGYGSTGSCRKDVSRALRDAVMEQGHALLDLERERLDGLQAILWPLAERGDVRAARELVRLMERRARLLGLDRAAADRFAADEADTAKGLLGNFAGALQAAYEAMPDPDTTPD
ncbi:hypothetical protein [Nocardioides donggukensis]|uniref:Uncharacterized protein n=1 Tax=Nocardioides donggukensis TaxID=2774019 RepID=A0A927Q234_9ACTN|nr:hypothetical protein [Nocardioides donggukensis]MBD8869296.1 hypothetical protein [Nocardioides donggukensis]